MSTSIDLVIDDCWNRIGVWRRTGAACPELERVIHCRNCERYAAAGRQILHRELAPGYRAEWTRILAEPKRPDRADSESVVIFRLGDEWLSIPSRCVHEITSARPVRRLPHLRRNTVKGLVNMRGELQLCVSLGSLLELDKGEAPRRFGSVGIADRMILIAEGEHRYVFPVTEVHGLHRYNLGDLQPVPATLGKSKASYTRGVLHWNDAHVACLDAELLFQSLNRSLG
ncbi:MAG: chemotaxis protein CheW [Gammaproteobacteria bacterium]